MRAVSIRRDVANSTSLGRRDYLLLLVSVLLQVILAALFGHAYDQRIFMATGYLVASGQNPYVAQDLSLVFHDASFLGITSIGYPPPWALVLGLVYRCVYSLFPSLIVYNFAIKLPIIAANIGLAYCVAETLRILGTGTRAIRKAWVFMLFNPFLFYFGTAWGQFDAIVALLALEALVLLPAGKAERAAFCLALAISFKPTSLALLPVSLVYLWGRSHGQAARYLGAFCASVVLFVVVPFLLFDWSPAEILHHWNAHMLVGGGMSPLTFLELVRNSYQLPGGSGWLGLVWVPALAFGLLSLRGGVQDLIELLKKSTALTLVFFLTRAWLSEPNITLILPFVLILTVVGELDALALTGVCALPLLFTVFNASPPQLLFPRFHRLMEAGLAIADRFRQVRLLIRCVLVLPWQAAGWWIVYNCFKKGRPQSLSGRTSIGPDTVGTAFRPEADWQRPNFPSVIA